MTHSITIETRSTSSSTTAEKEAFIQLFAEVMEDVHVEVTTTDGHLGIAAHMRSKYSEVIHNQVTIALCVNRATVLEYRYVATKLKQKYKL